MRVARRIQLPPRRQPRRRVSCKKSGRPKITVALVPVSATPLILHVIPSRSPKIMPFDKTLRAQRARALAGLAAEQKHGSSQRRARSGSLHPYLNLKRPTCSPAVDSPVVRPDPTRCLRLTLRTGRPPWPPGQGLPGRTRWPLFAMSEPGFGHRKGRKAQWQRLACVAPARMM